MVEASILQAYFLHLLFNGDTGLLQKPRDIRDCITYRMNQLEILRHYRNSLCYPRLELGGVLEIRINAETFFSSFAFIVHQFQAAPH